MKNIFKLFISAGFLAAATTGCTDLDVEITSQLTEFPESEIAAEAKLADVYYKFRGALGRRYSDMCALSSDEFTGISFDQDYYNSGENSHPTLHALTQDDVCLDWYGDLNRVLQVVTRQFLTWRARIIPQQLLLLPCVHSITLF